MFKNLLSLATEFMGGSSVEIYIYIGLLLGGFGAGFYVEHLRFSNYQIQIEQAAKAQEAHNEAVKKQHEIVTKGIQDEYDAKLSLLRQYYSNGVRQQSSSSSLPPNSGIAPKQFDALAAYNVLAGQCAETTAQVVELQKWINEQVGIK